MKPLRRISVIEQTAAHLRERLHTGHWKEELPGVIRLAQEFEVSKNTVRAALRQLELEGLLAPNGQNGRTIVQNEQSGCLKPKLRIVLLPRIRLDEDVVDEQNFFRGMQHALEVAGNICILSKISIADLGHDVRRISRLVRDTQADIWVVGGGSEELLQWFASQPIPVMAIGGRCLNVSIASVGVETIQPLVAATRQLIELGHRRITFISPRYWREKTPGLAIQAFTAELSRHGILPGDFNVPDWTESPEGLRELLTSLFRLTPPTAIIVQHQLWSVGVLAFLAERGLRIREHVSLISLCPDPAHAWQYPPLAHFHWRSDILIRRVTRWVDAVAKGGGDRKHVCYPVEFVPAGTVGPPPTTPVR